MLKTDLDTIQCFSTNVDVTVNYLHAGCMQIGYRLWCGHFSHFPGFAVHSVWQLFCGGMTTLPRHMGPQAGSNTKLMDNCMDIGWIISYLA